MYALWNARDYLTGKELEIDVPTGPPNGMPSRSPSCVMVQAELKDKDKQSTAEIPIVFYSADAHYSLAKTVALEQIQTFYQAGTRLYPGQCPLEGDWPYEVPTTNGTVHIVKLKKLVTFFTAKGHPAIVVFNYGSTFKGAYDDVETAGREIMEELESNQGGLYNHFYVHYEDQPPKVVKRLKVWIHVDGALAASYMPFLEMAYKHGKTDKMGPIFDFRLPFVCSINTSGHKWMGSPWACGIFMTRSKLVLKPPSNPHYVGSPDTTFAGSRNALSPVILWNYISTHSYDSQVEGVLRCFDRVQYIQAELLKLEKEHGNLFVERTDLALTIRFKRPNDRIVQKYSLGTETVREYDGNGELVAVRVYAHMFVMQSTTEKHMADFLKDLRTDPEPFPAQPAVSALTLPRQSLGRLRSKPLMNVPTGGHGFF